MIPQTFAYRRAGSVAEAIAILQEDRGAKLLAGGHSLLPLMKMRLANPETLVDISGVRELRGVEKVGDEIVIGALTTHAEAAKDPLIQRHLPALAEAAAQVGDLQVRNRGTVGGNLAHADPSSDLPAVALAYEARLTVIGPEGREAIAAEDFFLGPMVTALPEGHVVSSVAVPIPAANTKSAYLKCPHPASGYAVVGVAAAVAVSEDGTVEHARVGVTGAGDCAYRAYAVEEALFGQTVSLELIQEAAKHAAEDGSIGSDIYASEDYRRHLCAVYTERVLRKVLL
ncbi:MAG: xanthine dehydrogenase family protein subunit M [Alicyclobacillus herbarius]|uniref:FAD binding domain-containing protein n=1 Tax=Alicyclobacillus herbarius TaxID=122960 RepID=UPI00235681C9|nr:xanthine dehydrogenase family protein subunit M [Alicyclobacillus herbarius]MCL6631859.1 xanthine dehydrogenase family protein subunit M [Alicyclobacillus herbarius]